MGAAVGFIELIIFLYLASRTMKNTDRIVDNIIFCYVCQILNYKLVGSATWINLGFSLYASDCMVLLMLILWGSKGFRSKRHYYSMWVYIFVFMVLQACIRGVVTFGLAPEFWADLRKFLYFSVGILYFWNNPIKRNLLSFEKKLDRVFWGITIYAGVVLLFYFLGMPIGDRASQRPLLADHAIVYTAYTAAKWYKDIILSRYPRLSFTTLVFTATVILNRFNTTWVALVGAILILFLFRWWDKNKKPLSQKFYFQFFAIAVFICAFLKIAADSTIMQALMESSDKFDTSGNNTFSSRIELWGYLMETVKGIYAGIGFPFGNGFYVDYRGGKWLATPHNGYIETILRTGYIGIFALLMSMISIIKKAFTRRSVLPIMICAVCMIYWVGYSLTLEQGMLIGICAYYVFHKQGERV